MSSNVIAPIVSVVIGGALSFATLTGVINQQTAAPAQSPGNIEQPQFNYGTTVE